MNLNQGVLDGIRRIGGRFRDLTIDGGLPGAPLGLRLRGATTAGPPTAGTWKPGDTIEDRSGVIWICTAFGTPGTWVPAGNQMSVFGDGSDGVTVLDGSTGNSFSTLSADVYSMTRDAFCAGLLINSGVTLKVGGNRVFCAGALVNNGTITGAGNAGSGSTAGGSTGATTIAGGRAGGAGVATGTSGTGGNASVGTGNAGAGGAGTTGAVGSAGTTLSSATYFFKVPNPILTGLIAYNNASNLVQGAPGGSGGGGDGTNTGGGGGGGGGIVALLAWSVTNNGTITVAGGNGASPAAGNTGGGGGGSGGLVLAYTLAPWTAGTTTLTAGQGGTAHGTGSSNGNNGSAGTAMNIVLA